MTIYQAKGLEYEVVVVPRLIEGQFPDERDEKLLIPARAAASRRHRRSSMSRRSGGCSRGDDPRAERLCC